MKIPKLPYGEGSMYLRNDGLIMYRKCFRINNNSVKKTVYGSTPQECMQKMRTVEDELMNKSSPSKEVLIDAMNKWLETAKKPTLKPQSYRRLYSIVNFNIANSELGHLRYQFITPEEIQDFIDEYNKKDYSHSSIKKIYECFNSFYRYASTRYKFDNPMLTVIMPSVNNVHKETKSIEFFEQDDIDKFVSEAGATWNTGNPKYQGGYLYAANIYLGMRIGELLALQWKDIDFENKTIYVSKTLIEKNNPNYNENDPDSKKVIFEVQQSNKTSKNRYVPMNAKAEELIKSHKNISLFTDKDDYLISTRNRKTTTIKNASDTIKSMEKNAETKVQNSGTHILRHTCASLYFRKGVPIETICQILGNSREVCEKTYVHFIEEQLKDAANRIVPIIDI